jgi:hypothetical protein
LRVLIALLIEVVIETMVISVQTITGKSTVKTSGGQMSIKRSVTARTTMDRRAYKIFTDPDFKDPYYDEAWHYHTTSAYSWSFKWKRKQILAYQVRMYKTWKHNRKTQWKEKEL